MVPFPHPQLSQSQPLLSDLSDEGRAQALSDSRGSSVLSTGLPLAPSGGL